NCPGTIAWNQREQCEGRGRCNDSYNHHSSNHIGKKYRASRHPSTGSPHDLATATSTTRQYRHSRFNSAVNECSASPDADACSGS
ncbi:MAG TPA: hypothetical protein PKL51_03795, partial [Nitrospira sp.]|nr:hypothetical protein [Nitrospira sp.]